MTKPISFSHSSLKNFEGCARRYHEVAVLKKHPFTDTTATIYGKQLHEAAELYVRDNTPIPTQFAFIEPTLVALMSKPGRKLPEQKMALSVDLKACDWMDKKAWVRGIADLLIIDDDNLTAWVIDYKSGSSKYPDRDQLTLMSLMVFQLYPHIRTVKSALLFVVKNDMVRMRMHRDEVEDGWWKYRERVAKLEASFSNGVWNPTQTPLCGWCPCKSCEFNKKH